MAPKYRLTYFNFRGFAETVRYLFAYGNVDYEDVRIEKAQWPELKPKQVFGKIPVLEIDGIPLSESKAISRYVAKELGLAGKTNLEAARADMIVDALSDLFAHRSKFLFEPHEAKKEKAKIKFVTEHVPTFLDHLQRQFTANGTNYLVGDALTWADFAVACALNELRNYSPTILDKYDGLRDLTDRIHNFPAIKAWITKRPKTEI